MLPVHYHDVSAGGAFDSGLREKEYIEPWVGKTVTQVSCLHDYAWLLVSCCNLFFFSVCLCLCLLSYSFCWVIVQDYYSYYPVTLPVRRPYSGNPGVFRVASLKKQTKKS